jgi:hypothetical protein
MKISYSTYLLALAGAQYANAEGHMPCRGSCDIEGGNKICRFNVKVDLYAGELGYFTFEECGDELNPTIGVEKDVTYIFSQTHETNYYHPLGFAYYPDGDHDDKIELEPGITPPGSSSSCADDELCPAPMYFIKGDYVGVYSNNDAFIPVTSDEDFGLDVYEPAFLDADPMAWNSAGAHEVTLKFDVDDFTKDIFYFCHIHQFMSGRIKFINKLGVHIQSEDVPELGYSYDEPSAYDQSCGTYGLDAFQLPNSQCPSEFVCNPPDVSTPAGLFADCLDSMNCAMMHGMTTNVQADSPIALFIHQMIPHHQNAVNMCKALSKTHDIDCDDMSDEDDPHCVMRVCYEIINGQNYQIQTMRSVLEASGYAETDDCVVEVAPSDKGICGLLC